MISNGFRPFIRLYAGGTAQYPEKTPNDRSKRKETEILREEYRYAAESIEDVWKAIEYQRNDPEMTVIAIIEEHPAITVLVPKDQP